MLETLPDGRAALEHVLDDLGRQGGLIMLGGGEPEYEHRMADVAERHASKVLHRMKRCKLRGRPVVLKAAD